MISKEEQKKLNDELLEASEKGRLAEVKELIKKGAEVETRDQVGCTPLHLAAFNGNLEVVKYLVEEAKAEAEAINDGNWTPLHLVFFEGHLEVLQYLFLERNVLMPIFGLFSVSMEHMGKNTKAQNIFAYVLQNKHRYTVKELKSFKTLFLELNMNDEDTRNLKPIVKFF